jgi:PAS domain S-box-containing protein
MRGVALFCSGLCLVMALLVLTGWMLNIDFLRNPLGEHGGMNSTAGLCFVVLSTSMLLFLTRKKKFEKTAYALTLFCFLLASYRLVEDLVVLYTPDEGPTVFTPALSAPSSASALPMSPNGATTFVLLCMALVLLTKGKVWAGQMIAALATVIAFFTLLGHINRVPEFLGLLPYLPMALYKNLCFLLLSMTLFAFHHDQGVLHEIKSAFLGGRIARILLPLVVLVPFLFGYLSLLLYWRHLISAELSISLLVMSVMIFFTVVTVVNIILLNRQDAERKKNEMGIQQHNQKLKESNEEIAALHEEMVAANEELTIVNEQLHAASEKIKAQAAIIVQQKDEHLNRALDSTHVVIWSMDLTGKGQNYISRSIEKISGVPAAEFLNKRATWNRFIVSEDLKIRHTAMRHLKAEDHTEAVLRIRDRNNEIRWISFQIKVIRDQEGHALRQEGMAADITSMKETEQALTKERSLLRSLIDNIPDYIFVKDRSLHYILNNKANLSLLNASSETDTLTKTSKDYFGEAAAAFHQDDLRVLCNGEVILNKEEVLTTAMGSRTVLTTKVPLYDSSGVVQGIVGISRDVTESRKSEQLLNHYRENLDIIFQATLEKILLLDKEGRVVLFNKALEEFFISSTGKPPVIGNYLWETTLPERGEMARSLFAQAMTGRPTTTDAYVKMGNTFLVHELRYQPIFIDREVKYVMVTSLDITERRNQETSIRQSEGNLRAIFNTTADSFILLDTSFRIKAFNEAFRKYSMLDVKLAEGMNLIDLATTERQEIFRNYLNRAKQGETIKYEVSTLHDQSKKWYQITITPVKDNHDDVIGICIASTDLTSHKQAEQERIILIRKLTEQNDDLHQFSFITSHQLQGPVATMQGLLNLIKHEDVPEGLQQLLTFMNHSVQRLDQVIRDLSLILNINREVGLPMEWVNIRELVTHIKKEMEPDFITSKATLSLHCDEIDSFHSIKIHLHSILYQLISNAIKFRAKGRPLIIEIATFKDDTGVGFIVKDNGMGIDLTQFKDKIFKLYERFHLDIEGKGLGLYMVYTLAKQINGNIQVTSEPGAGTAFTVTIFE